MQRGTPQTIWPWIASFYAVFACGICCGAEERPNILLVLSDDHSAALVGCYGNRDVRTPQLDALAAEGLRCERAYVACPQCVPSRAAIMTGRSPVAVQMTRFTAPLPRDVVTYPELLRKSGYFTGVAGRTYHLDGAPPELMNELNLKSFPERLDFVKQAGNRAEMLAQYREFLDRSPKDKPFFLQLCFSDPHRPYDAPSVHDPARLTLPPHYPDTPGVRADLAAIYDEIARFDGDLKEVLDELKTRGISDNTLVAVMGDNGSAQFRGKGTLNELGVHVPLIVRWPKCVKPGRASSALISGEDLAPTFLEAAGAPVPAEMTGHSFLPLLRDASFEPRKFLFAERGAHGGGLPTGSAAFDLGRCIVTPTHKLIYNATWQLPYQPVDFNGMPFFKELVQLNSEGKLDAKLAAFYFAPQRPMFELYDLAADPWELTNLAGRPELSELEAGLKRELAIRMVRERDFVPLPITEKAKSPGKAKAKARRATP
jgi:arylsulfatase A-like enzyme